MQVLLLRMRQACTHPSLAKAKEGWQNRTEEEEGGEANGAGSSDAGGRQIFVSCLWIATACLLEVVIVVGFDILGRFLKAPAALQS